MLNSLGVVATLLALANSLHGQVRPSTTSPNSPNVLSAASATTPVSAGAIVAIYGSNFANDIAVAGSVPLPEQLDGVSANFVVTNILGGPVFSGPMPLFYVSPTQINAQVPPNATFPACAGGSGSVYNTNIQITTPSGMQTAPVTATPAPGPGLFTANEKGSGVAAAQFVTNLPDGTQTIEYVAQCPGGVGSCVPIPLNVTAGTSALALWGTGISEYSTFPQGLTVMANNQPLEVFYAGPSPQYVGLDQTNVWLPAGMAGSGTVNLSVSLTGTTPGVGIRCGFTVTSKMVTIDIQQIEGPSRPRRAGAGEAAEHTPRFAPGDSWLHPRTALRPGRAAACGGR